MQKNLIYRGLIKLYHCFLVLLGSERNIFNKLKNKENHQKIILN